jgi:uncharacterized Zn finger protein (UPF0148 family)
MSRDDVARILADVAEGHCPLCRTPLLVHDGRACCLCGGCSFRVSEQRFEMLSPCAAHPIRICEHWQAVFASAGRISGGEV